MNKKANQTYAPLNIRFFDNKDRYISDFLNGVKTARQLTVLLYVLSQYYYKCKDTNRLELSFDKKFNKKSCFLKEFKISNNDILREITRLNKTKYISNIECNDNYIDVFFISEFLYVKDKSKRFTICLNELLSFKYIEHSILYILTRYGKSESYLYHNYLCKVLHLHHLPFTRQKQRLKRIFALLKKRGFIMSYRYENYTYFYEREVFF